MTPKETILKHREFVEAIALYRLIPQRDNIIVKELKAAWKQHLIDIKSKLVVGDCDGCGNGTIGAIKDFYVEAKRLGWFDEQSNIQLKQKGRPKNK
jgi:hypothetical protein